MEASRNIVIAVDRSKDSEYAVHWAIRNHLRPNDKVTLLHVKPPAIEQPGPGVYAAFNDVDNSEESIKRKNFHEALVARELEEKLVKACSEAKISCETAIVQDAEARERICNEVEKRGASTLIMGSRGMGAIKRMFLGSTSDYCVHHAPCPVVVVRAPEA